MAKPISEIRNAKRDGESLEELILQAGQLNLSEYIDAIEETLQLLKNLKESGLLSMVSAFVAHYQDSTDIVVDQLSREKNHKAVRNILTIYTLLSNVEPDKLRNIAEKGAKELMDSTDSSAIGEPLGILQFLRLMKDPETASGIRVMMSLIRAFAYRSGD